MMNDQLLKALTDFMDAVDERLKIIPALEAEIGTLRTELRAAPAAVTTALPAPEPGKPGKDGTDGVGIKSLLMRGDDLVITLTDGTEHNVGRVKGEPGEPGKDGEDGEDGAPSTVPGPKGDPGEPSTVPGPKGEPGVASVEQIEEIVERRVAELQTRTLADAYRGVFKAGEEYRRGDLVTWDGSLSMALVATRAAPGEKSEDWKLVTRKGRDGRDRR